MKVARFDFDLSLQPLLQRDLRGHPVDLRFQGPQSVKHLIESLGIPHTEIGPLAVNGESIGLEYIVHDGDRIVVRPVPPADLTEEPRFVLDGHLGRLASHLRMLGLDCLYDNGYEDDELVNISVEQQRILLTRDRLLLMHKVITRGYLLRSLDSTEQLHEVVKRYG
ncbi:MAG: Mut7-C RNAse domain-containing protein, partial [Anaerolineales bacterium]